MPNDWGQICISVVMYHKRLFNDQILQVNLKFLWDNFLTYVFLFKGCPFKTSAIFPYFLSVHFTQVNFLLRCGAECFSVMPTLLLFSTRPPPSSGNGQVRKLLQYHQKKKIFQQTLLLPTSTPPMYEHEHQRRAVDE